MNKGVVGEGCMAGGKKVPAGTMTTTTTTTTTTKRSGARQTDVQTDDRKGSNLKNLIDRHHVIALELALMLLPTAVHIRHDVL
jgi:hypothetical protein